MVHGMALVKEIQQNRGICPKIIPMGVRVIMNSYELGDERSDGSLFVCL